MSEIWEKPQPPDPPSIACEPIRPTEFFQEEKVINADLDYWKDDEPAYKQIIDQLTRDKELDEVNLSQLTLENIKIRAYSNYGDLYLSFTMPGVTEKNPDYETQLAKYKADLILHRQYLENYKIYCDEMARYHNDLRAWNQHQAEQKREAEEIAQLKRLRAKYPNV